MSELLKSRFDKMIISEYSKVRNVNNDLRGTYNFRITVDTYFVDMIWDFSFFNTKNRSAHIYRLDFNKIPTAYVFYVKLTILNEIVVKKNSMGTVKHTYCNLKTITRELYIRNITDTRLINKIVVSSLINDKANKNKDSYVESIGISFKKMLYIIQETDGNNLEDAIDYLTNTNKLCYEKRPIKAVNDYIPDSFLNQIVSAAIKDIDNADLKIDDRTEACLIVIVAETGMRGEEGSLLETNKLDTLIVGGKEVNYLRFLTFKTQQYKSDGKETYTWLSDKATKAYRMCEKLVNKIIDGLSETSKLRLMIYLNTKQQFKRRVSKKELRQLITNIDKDRLIEIEKECRRYLFISEKTGTQKRGTSVFRENLGRFFIRHAQDLSIENIPLYQRKSIKTLKITSRSKYEKFFSLDERRHISYESILETQFLYVNPHMFRVTLCTKLFKQGVHIDFITKHMNHLSEDMTTYYDKSQQFVDTLAESINELVQISNERGLIETDVCKIKDSYFKRELNNDYFRHGIEKINEFLGKNKLNIKRDINQVLTLLKRTSSTAMENEFGVCIRSVIYGICQKRNYFSSLSDNYFIGVQLPTYKFINYTYQRVLQKISIVKHNREIADRDKRYISEYEREDRALRLYVNKTLLIELNLLENDLDMYGANKVLYEQPQLKQVVEEIDDVRKVVKQWIN